MELFLSLLSENMIEIIVGIGTVSTIILTKQKKTKEQKKGETELKVEKLKRKALKSIEKAKKINQKIEEYKGGVQDA